MTENKPLYTETDDLQTFLRYFRRTGGETASLDKKVDATMPVSGNKPRRVGSLVYQLMYSGQGYVSSPVKK